MKKNLKISIKGIICRGDSVLMLKDHKGNWELPGGGIEIGEHPNETLKREFKEELGVDAVRIESLVDVWDFYNETEQNLHQFIIIVYSCSVNFSELIFSSEHLDMKWVGLNQVNNVQMRDGYKKSLTKFKNMRSESNERRRIAKL